jgi:predicted dehydrogenase
MKTLNRRAFVVKSFRGASALITAPMLLNSLSYGRADPPSERLVLALIGAGGRGSSLAKGLAGLGNIQFKYVCDVNDRRGVELMGELEKAQGRPPKRLIEMREAFDDKEIDAVVVATPEHWHALATVWACQAGKDVYVEKTPSLTLWEGRQMVEAARKYKRIVQVGLQNRSAPYTASARDYIQSGKLGRVVEVKVFNLLGGAAFTPQPDCPAPKGLDWDRWLGPAPAVPYNPGRHLGWYDWWDYKGGAMVDDAIHQIDLARAVLSDPPHPKSVCCVGGNYAYHSKREVPELQSIVYDFGDFAMTCDSGNATNYMRKFPNEVRYGSTWPHWPTSATRVEIYGTKGLMLLGQHGCGWQVIVEGGKLVEQDKGYFPDKWHQPNFIECIRSRKMPNADSELGHRSACLVHLANLSYRVGNKQLLFDSDREQTDNKAANHLLKPAYRKQYRMPEQV